MNKETLKKANAISGLLEESIDLRTKLMLGDEVPGFEPKINMAMGGKVYEGVLEILIPNIKDLIVNELDKVIKDLRNEFNSL